MTYVSKKQHYGLPKRSTPDSVSELVRAILSQRGIVQRVVITAEPGGVDVELLVPSTEPPHGEVPTDDPQSVWQSLQRLELIEVQPEGINPQAAHKLSAALLQASTRELVGVGLVVQDAATFARWVGVSENETPAMFWNMPLIELRGVPEDKLIVLCAKSVRMGPLKSICGILIELDSEEGQNVGQRE